MRSTTRMIATAAFAILLMSAFILRGEGAATPAAGAKDGKSVDSNSISVATPEASMPEGTPPASPYSSGRNLGVPRVELFLGYSYLRAVPTLAVGNRLIWLNGGSASIAFNVNRYLGLVGDFGAYTNSKMQFTGAYTSTVNVNNANAGAFSYLSGPRLSFRQHERITPFAQALFGGMHANQVTLTGCTVNCTILPSQSSFAMTAGGGLDVRVRHHLAIRVIQAEYLMNRFDSYTTGAAGTQDDMRLSAGLVFRFGGNPHVAPLPPVTYSCLVNPVSGYPGDAIAVSGTAINLDPAKTAAYTWTANGGTLTGTSNTTSIDTRDAAPGTYTLKGHISEGARA